MSLCQSWNQKSLHDGSMQSMQSLKSQAQYTKEIGSYAIAKTEAEKPLIPSPAVFVGLSDVKTLHGPGATAIPTTAECAVHLELLQAFRALRKQVLESTALDTIFDIKPNPKTVTKGANSKKLKDNTFAARRREKWPLFIDLAVARFKVWFEDADEHLASKNAYGDLSQTVDVPPLDILMVWHSFLLNPKMFAKHCETYAQTRIRKIPFPWASVHASIDHADWSFALSKSTAVTAHRSPRADDDLFAFLSRNTMAPALNSLLAKFRHQTAVATNVILPSTGLLPHERALVRCCLDARSGSPLNKSLADTVKRQVAFIDKMDAHLWIRSPALLGTLQRAVSRYEQFLRLMKTNPGTMLVPTLDVDLAWHTHQLSHSHYRAATQERAGRFVDHDDKLGKGTLDDGMEKTAELWRVRFGEEYRVCQCWDCEALRSAPEMEDGVDAEGDEAVIEGILADVQFHRTVEIARRNGKPLPARRSHNGSMEMM